MQSLNALSGRSTSHQGENGQTCSDDGLANNETFKISDQDKRTASRFKGAGGLVAVVFILIMAGLFYGGFDTRVSLFASQLAENWLLRAGVTLQEVRIKGQVNLSDEQIFKALGIRSGQSLVGFDAHQAQQKLRALGQVETARVMRLLPSTLLVEITERRPFARWLHEGQVNLVDKQGVVLSKVSHSEESSYPLISGAGAAPQAARLIRLLSVHQELSRRIKMAQWVGRYRWNLHAGNGVVIMLPPAELALSLARLISLPDWQSLLERPHLVVDLRSAHKAFVRVRDVKSLPLFPDHRGGAVNA